MNTLILQVIAGALIAFGIVYISIPLLRKVAYKSDIYDKPDNDRKLHDRYVPTLGGVAIYLAFFIGFSVSGYADQINGFSYFAAALTLLFFTGLKDDLVDLSAFKKLQVEIIAAMLIIFGSGMTITNFYGVFGIYEIPYWVGVLLTTFTVIVIVNSYNLIDGIDGLAAGVGAIATIFFGIGFYVAGEYAMAVMASVLVVALLTYLKFNFNPAQIFMGDTGSLVVGFLLAVLAIKFVGLNESTSYVEVFGATSSIIPVAILALPLFDTITVFYKRLRRGDSPFKPGQDHIHHSIIKMGFGQKSTAIILYGCSTFITLIAFSLRSLDINIVFAITVLSMFLFLPTNGFKRKALKKMGIDLEQHFESKNAMLNFKEKSGSKKAASSTRMKEKEDISI